MADTMSAEMLIAAARRNRTGIASSELLEPESVGAALRQVLTFLLSGIDYDGDLRGDAAVSARMIAALIVCADEIAGSAPRH